MATNYSSRRQAVLQVLQSTKSHPSAESIFEQCRLLIPNISLGTVYRNLALLEERGEIIKVANVAGVDRYDATTEPHVHNICPCCGNSFRATKNLNVMCMDCNEQFVLA